MTHDMPKGTHSFRPKGCMPPASNTRTIQNGAGFCTRAEFQCSMIISEVRKLIAVLLSLLRHMRKRYPLTVLISFLFKT